MALFLLGCAWALTGALALLIAHALYNHKPELTRYAIGAGVLLAAIIGWAWCVEAIGQRLTATDLTLATGGITFLGWVAVVWAHDKDAQKQAASDRARGGSWPSIDQEP